MLDMLFEASLLLHSEIAFAYLMVALVIVTTILFQEGKRLPFLFAAFMLTLLVSTGLKYALAVERPCSLDNSICPQDPSMPSTHAASAFIVAIVMLGSRAFPFYLALALLTSLSRIYLGVHTFADVAAGLAVALLSYALCEMVWKSAGFHWSLRK
jgi:membrane-associated phospholipid phosphatase